MRVRLRGCILFLSLLFYPVICSGQDGVEEQYYNFDDMLIDGSYRDPQGMFERSRAESQFDGIVRLHRSFLDEISLSCEESHLKL